MIAKTSFAGFLICITLLTFATDRWAQERLDMVASQIVRRGVRDQAVLDALRAVPRHRFVPDDLKDHAYSDRPLPIGHGQTISQPYIVAVMTEMLQLQPNHIVLEVGTGSGYQAAILAEIVQHVYSIEIIDPLRDRAERLLTALATDRVTAKTGDGYYGWPEHGPYDAIIVTAAASHIPPPLIEQLKPGGRMVIPVGPVFSTQYLMLVEKRSDGTVVKKKVMAVRFVPLTGKH